MNRNAMRLILCVAGATLFAIGLAGGLWWARHSAGDRSGRSGAAATVATERKVLYWYDPMVPDQHFDKPGKSPFMDMQLVPKYADEAASAGVRISSDMQQSVGIRTVVVDTGTLASAIRVPGTLTWDLRQEVVVSARVEGIVTRVEVKAPFEPVHRGQTLATLLAPEWSSALAEAQALGDARSASARELRSAAQQRLRVLGVSGRSGRDGVTLTAPGEGVVSEVLVREGQTVMPGMPLFRINGTTTLWLEAAIPQAGVAGIRPGTPVEATTSAMPGQTFRGEVERLLPVVDALSRTQRARIVLRNPDGVLAPGMFAEVTLQPAAGAPVPLIPSEALIATGDDSRVIVQTATGAFRPVRVRTGRSGGGRTEILAGLSGGERVVVSGQFLIDSEASLSGALARMGEVPAPPAQAAMPKKEDTLQASPHPLTTSEPMPDMRTKPDAHSTMPKLRSAQPAPRTPPARTCAVAYWYDPMVPDQHFDKPGKSPFMDMQLVPKFAPGAASDCTIRDVKTDGGEAQP
jgi:Cu(I)/Ag(I) efflux system membrane fusion protein